MNNNNVEKNTLKDQSSTKNNAEPSLCVGCFEFFGNPACENFCSSCYKKKQKELKSAPKANTSTQSSAQATSQQTSSSETSTQPAEESKENEKPKQTDTSKCWNCSKKVGVMGIACRCGYTFCKNHRLPEEHSCDFDYATKGREALKESNPTIQAAKLNKI